MKLLPGNIHIWYAPLDVTADRLAHCRSLLVASEMLRANRYKFTEHRRRFTVARATLRSIINYYTNMRPHDIKLYENANGKPMVSGRLQFNLSHSHELAVYAFTLDADIGVDVEQVRPIQNIDSLIRNYYSPIEQTYVLNRPKALLHERFLDVWVRKEAWIKAIGTGLSHSLTSFSVTCDEPGTVNGVADDWTLRHLNAPFGYIAAVAAPEWDWQITEMAPELAHRHLESLRLSPTSPLDWGIGRSPEWLSPPVFAGALGW